jgi:hypothetical protein
MRKDIAMKKQITLWGLLGTMLSVLAFAAVISIPAAAGAGFLSIASADDQDAKAEKEKEKQWRKAVEYLEWGWAEVDKADTKLEEGKPKKAQEHFAVALDFFDRAIKHFAKATLTPEQQEGFKDLQQGFEDLDKANKAFSEGKQDKGQKYFESGQELLKGGMAAFDAGE